ncbi:MAG: spore coat protein U domain-containing protein [Candidatus Eremiobacteraeota bacterium]|nr:spore coat protein U domain-containing protein [Candidatus Eremiobacteraeota bacterium]
MRRFALTIAAVVALACPFAIHPLKASATRPYYGCRFNPLTLSFGQYDVFNPNATPIAGSLTYVCAHMEDDVHISISAGQSNTYINRYMTNTADPKQRLRYQLSLSPDCGRPFGDGFDDSDDYDLDPRTETGSIHIFGVVYPRQDVSAGRYSDQLEVTINY